MYFINSPPTSFILILYSPSVEELTAKTYHILSKPHLNAIIGQHHENSTLSAVGMNKPDSSEVRDRKKKPANTAVEVGDGLEGPSAAKKPPSSGKACPASTQRRYVRINAPSDPTGSNRA